MKKLNITLIIMMMGLAPQAFAKKSKRDGFNFGTSVRVIETDDRTTAGIGSDRDTHTVDSSQMVVPYVGYSFGSFNLGIVLSSEQVKSSRFEKSEDGTSESLRESDLSSKSASLYTRFLFGKVFFFEAGAGLVSQRLNVLTENKTKDMTGTFTGDEDEYEINGVGPAYHVGAGLEIEMGGGFYFTSAYHTRIIQLRDYNGNSQLGAKRSFEQKREVLFGLAHYTR